MKILRQENIIMNKRFIFSLLAVLIFIVFLNITAFGQEVVSERPDIMIIINGEQKIYSNPPIIINGRALLPLRELLNNLGIVQDTQIQWDDSSKSITINDGDRRIFLQIGNKNAKLNSIDVAIDVAPVIYKSRTYIPVRFVSQSFEKNVVWDNISENLLIRDKDEYSEIKAILDEMNRDMDGVKRLKRIDNIDFKFNLEGKEHGIKSKVEIISDYEKKKELSILNRTATDEALVKKLEIFSDNNKQKIRIDKEEWKSFDVDEVTTKKAYSFSELEGTDILYCGLGMSKDENTKEIILEGRVNLFDYSHGAISFEGFKDYQLDNVLSRIVLDMDTKLVKEIKMTASLPQKYEKENKTVMFNIAMKTVYTDYNGDFVVSNPEP